MAAKAFTARVYILLVALLNMAASVLAIVAVYIPSVLAITAACALSHSCHD